jgi:hypothetical protein
MRKNLEKIVELRNASAHLVTEEYEIIYFPLFQSCVLNFVEKMQEYHSIDVEKAMPQSFLNLIVSTTQINYVEIRSKYPQVNPRGMGFSLDPTYSHSGTQPASFTG